MVRETEHFTIITNDENPIYIDDVVSSLEDSYHRIISSLGMEDNDGKITVKIYPTIEEFHTAMKMAGVPNWVLGSISGINEFSMASPISPGLPVSYEVMVNKLPIHEFTHVVVYNIVNPENIPYWLWEGVSLYMANQQVNLSEISLLNEGNFPSFEELSSMENSFRFGYSLVEFIVHNWSFERLKALLLSNGDIPATFYISTEKFHQDWQVYVFERYF